MPLETEIIRDGEALKMPKGWGGFHVAAMVIAASIDSGEGPFKGMRKGHRYVNNNYKVITKHEKPAEFHPSDCEMEQAENDPQMCSRCGHVLPILISRGDSFQLMNYMVIGQTPLNYGEYVLQDDYEFLDITDDELLQLHKGDKLHAYRVSK